MSYLKFFLNQKIVYLSILLFSCILLFGQKPFRIYNFNEIVLLKKQYLYSKNGQYTLRLQNDGNLVLYQGKIPRWSSNTVGSGAERLIFQGDGNLVMYNQLNNPVWASNSVGKGNHFNLQEDGNLVIYNSTKIPIWSTNTNGTNSKPYKNYDALPLSKTVSIVNPYFARDEYILATVDAVLDYGADPSGLTNSSSAIQKALDYCRNLGGGTVWLPKGFYKIEGRILVHPFCTIIGDWNDPKKNDFDIKKGYGTVLLIEPRDISITPINIKASAGIDGLTFYYKNQNPQNPIPYEWTINMADSSLPGDGYMSSSVKNVTLLNSYKGIARNKSSTANEVVTIKNIRGTPLSKGYFGTNGADVSAIENIHFSSKYWVEASMYFNNQINNLALKDFLFNHAVALEVGDVEWDQFVNLEIDGYQTALKIVKGTRIKFSGVLSDSKFTKCKNGVVINELEAIDPRWTLGFSLSNSTIEAKDFAYYNPNHTFSNLNHTTILSGSVRGANLINNPSQKPPNYKSYPAEPTRKKGNGFLIDLGSYVDFVPRVLPNTTGSIPVPLFEISKKLQEALNKCAANGGGVVYMPAGFYLINSPVVIPSNVELRGSSSSPIKASRWAGGTSIITSYGFNSKNPLKDQALFTLQSNAGLSGLMIFHPDNFSLNNEYPYDIRIIGNNSFVTNVNLVNPYLGISAESTNYYLERILGTSKFYFINASKGGLMKNILSNPNTFTRNAYNIHNWINEQELFNQIINPTTRQNQIFINLNDNLSASRDTHLLNTFCYGCYHGIYNNSQNTKAINHGVDNLNNTGYSIIATKTIFIANTMRFNGLGTTLGFAPHGNIVNYNDNILDNSLSSKENRYFNVTSTALKTKKIAHEIFMFPNPAKGKLYVKIMEPISKILLFDSYGNQKANISYLFNKLTNTASLDVTNFEAGLYLIGFYGNNDELIQSKKLYITN